MASAHDFGALNWVKSELDETIRQARCALENFVEQPTEPSTILSCIKDIHQVQGILHVVQLYGPAMLAEEMELVAVALRDGKIRQLEDAAEALMLALIQFPDYLEKLQGGEPDIPLVILPLMNDLRAARDASLLSEAALFSPALEGSQVVGRVDGDINHQLPDIARRIRHRYHLGLLNWFRNMGDEKAFQLLAGVLGELAQHAGSEQVHRLFWVAQSVVEGLKEGDVGSGVAVKLLLGKVDREIKRIIDDGETGIIAVPPIGLLKNLLYYVAQSTSENPHLAEVKSTYQLHNALPSEDEIAAGRKSLNSLNVDLLESVKSAINSELTIVKDTLDLYIRGDRSDITPLVKIKQPLCKVADTLGMVGQGALRSRLVRQVDCISGLEASESGLDDSVLMDMAGDILFVESTVNSLSEISSVVRDEGSPEATWGAALPPGEYQALVKKAVHEAKVDIAKVKEAIVSFVSLPSDPSVLDPVPCYFRNVCGALKILLLTDASDTLEQLSCFIRDELLEKGVQLEGKRLNALAEVISCIEYYLESLAGGVGDRKKTLEIAQASMVELLTDSSFHSSPIDSLDEVPLDEALTEEPVIENASIEPSVEPQESEALYVEEVASIESPPSSEKPPLEDIDPEILEIFVEEAREELEGLEIMLPRLITTPEDGDILITVRRSFHTIKGSGRMVGAFTIGELAWSVENMLNRLLDETIPASPMIFQLLDDVVAVLPQLVDCLERSEVPCVDSASLMARANAFSENRVEEGIEVSAEESDSHLEFDQEMADSEMGEGLSVDSDYSPPQDEDSMGYERDTELMDIFVSEAEGHLSTIEAFAQNVLPSNEPLQMTDDVIRAAHTLRGCARTAGISAIAQLGEELENFSNIIKENERPVDNTCLSLIQEGVDLGQVLLSALLDEDIPFPDHVPYLARLKIEIEQAEAKAAPHDLMVSALASSTDTLEGDEQAILHDEPMGIVVLDEDKELLEIFVEEARELTAELLSGLQVWRRTPDSWPQVVDLKRILHTLKGSSRLVGATPMGDLSHALELLLATLYQQQKVDDATIGLVQRGAERLVSQADEVERDASVTLASELVDEIRAFTASLMGGDAQWPNANTDVVSEGAVELDETDLTFDELLKKSSPQDESDALLILEDGVDDFFEETKPQQPLTSDDDDIQPVIEPPQESDELECTVDSVDLVFIEDESRESEVSSPLQEDSKDLNLDDEYGLAADSVESIFADTELYASENRVELTADEELIEIFLEEATELSESLESTMRRWHDGDDKTPIIEQFLRTLHTIKGSARLAGAMPIGDLSHALESLLTMIGRDEIEEDAKIKHLIQLGIDRLAGQIEEAENNRSVASAGRLIERLDQVCGGKTVDLALPDEEVLPHQDEAGSGALLIKEKERSVEPTPQVEDERAEFDEFSDLSPNSVESIFADSELYEAEAVTELTGDDELIEIFIEEARQLSESLEDAIQRWHTGDDELPIIDQMLRILHTVKGSARLAGAQPVGDLSHAIESLLVLIDNGRIEADSKVKRLIQLSIDRLGSQLDEVESKHSVASADKLIERLEQLCQGAPSSLLDDAVENVAETSETLPDAPVSEKRIGAVTDSDGGAISRFSYLLDEDKESDETTGISVPRTQVRINSALLDKMVNQAGEVSIFRSRLEQQNSSLKFNLAELERTVVRLHEQLRKLDIETETQILFRHERDVDKGGDRTDFDPLELDRFSTMQQVSRSLMETVSDLGSIRELLDEQQRDTETLLLQQSRVAVELQDGLLHTRMVPFSQLVPRLSRLVRQTAIQTGREAELTVVGAEGEIDRSILDRIIPALEHLLRNAVAHGIEPPQQRLENGKPKSGKITLTLSNEGTNVLLLLQDDGAGLNLKKIYEKAVSQGLLAEGDRVTDDDLMQLVLESGFSTAKEITQIAGRGVGLDAVSSEVKQLGGLMTLDSETGKGTCFTIQLPLTLAITDALLVQMGEHIYAVPHGSIEGVVRIEREALLKYYEDPERRYDYAGKEYKVEYLGHLLASGTPALLEGERWYPVLLVDVGEHQIALQVDALLGTRQVVVKGIGSQISSLRWVTGGTILADGRVALIADMSALVRSTSRRSAERLPVDEVIEDSTVTAMVVDDSITVRKVTARLLERHDMQVITAKDGVDAISVLQEHQPDVVLLDIEMPRMDGFELARHMRNSPDWCDIPIIMISSRVGEKHRKRAFELGVKSCLGKPFQEIELLDNIQAVLKERQT